MLLWALVKQAGLELSVDIRGVGSVRLLRHEWLYDAENLKERCGYRSGRCQINLASSNKAVNPSGKQGTAI